MKKELNKELNRAVQKGSSRVGKLQSVQKAKDKLRKEYGSEVINSVVFGTAHPLKEQYLKELKKIR